MLFISPKYEDYVFPFVTNKWWHVSVVTVLVPPPPPPPQKRDVTTETLPNIMVVTILDTSEPSSKMLIPP